SPPRDTDGCEGGVWRRKTQGSLGTGSEPAATGLVEPHLILLNVDFSVNGSVPVRRRKAFKGGAKQVPAESKRNRDNQTTASGPVPTGGRLLPSRGGMATQGRLHLGPGRRSHFPAYQPGTIGLAVRSKVSRDGEEFGEREDSFSLSEWWMVRLLKVNDLLSFLGVSTVVSGFTKVATLITCISVPFCKTAFRVSHLLPTSWMVWVTSEDVTEKLSVYGKLPVTVLVTDVIVGGGAAVVSGTATNVERSKKVFPETCPEKEYTDPSTGFAKMPFSSRSAQNDAEKVTSSARSRFIVYWRPDCLVMEWTWPIPWMVSMVSFEEEDGFRKTVEERKGSNTL
ncbi:MAG: hypothetical protein BJ554DRAFT_6268, partial [Olpidium bornovanus]